MQLLLLYHLYDSGPKYVSRIFHKFGSHDYIQYHPVNKKKVTTCSS